MGPAELKLYQEIHDTMLQSIRGTYLKKQSQDLNKF